jgi:hypothetical protein
MTEIPPEKLQIYTEPFETLNFNESRFYQIDTRIGQIRTIALTNLQFKPSNHRKDKIERKNWKRKTSK